MADNIKKLSHFSTTYDIIYPTRGNLSQIPLQKDVISMSSPTRLEIDELFNKIYDQSYLAVMKYVSARTKCADDAADVVQETFLELYRVLVKKAGYVNDYNAFVMSIAKRKLFRHYSLGEKLKMLLPLYKDKEDEADIIDEIGAFEFEDELIDGVLLEEIWQYISAFENDTREIFNLKFKKGLSLEEISEELNLPIHTVRNKLYRSMERLKEKFADGKGARK
jgi:RNA polymerase sigma factor (sigma-70 family)